VKSMKTFNAIITVFALTGLLTSSVYASHRQSGLENKIDDLDDDPVENIAIPVLFGVTLTDITPNFGEPRDGGAREHEGLDMLAPSGTPIVTPTEAVVVRVDTFPGAGKSVVTANPGGERFHYYHLDSYARGIGEGDELSVGDIIGYVGNTGNAEGGAAHLHLEIREDGDPLDPYERITKEFTLKQKITFLEEILEDSADEEELAEFLVDEYVNDFILARAQGIELPSTIVDALPPSVASSPTSIPVRDLSVGAQGTDVTLLQSILIAEGHLTIGAPTGYFGPLTQAALASYQRIHGIAPASGYYGPITRAKLMAGVSSSPASRAELLAKIVELEREVQKLQALLAGK
jgi:hypothetical protein